MSAANQPATEPKKPVGSAPQSGTDVVSIALKTPNGIVLQAYEMVQGREQTPSGFRDIPTARQVGEPFTLHGAELPRGAARPLDLEYLIVGGFAITPGCPRDLWESWYAANKDSALVKNGLIFMVNDARDARAEAKSRAAIELGFEPIDPDDPMRKTKGRDVRLPGGWVSAIAPADKSAP